MAQIDHYIATLLEDHDCVIVPHFGGFVANYAPARINPVNHRFDPPSRKLSFNKLLTHNDGLLASYVARKEQENYEDGIRIVQEFAIYLNSELKHNKRVKLDRVGMISKNADGSLRFEQVENANFFSDGTGLESFFAKKVEQEKPEVVEEKSKPEKTIVAPVVKPTSKPEPKVVTLPLDNKEEPVKIPVEDASSAEVKTIPIAPIESNPEEVSEPRSSSRKWIVRTAAAVIALPLIGYAVWFSAFGPKAHGDGSMQASDLNPFSKGSDSVYTERDHSAAVFPTDEPIGLTEMETEDFLSLTSSNAPDKTMVVTKKTATSSSNEILRYHIIGGCFGMESNATGLANKYADRGNHASIIDKKGSLYRVSVASFATKKEARQALTSLKNEIPGVWLLYK